MYSPTQVYEPQVIPQPQPEMQIPDYYPTVGYEMIQPALPNTANSTQEFIFDNFANNKAEEEEENNGKLTPLTTLL